jgi:hypothetical protein
MPPRRDSFRGSPHREISIRQARWKRGILDRAYPQERAEADMDLRSITFRRAFEATSSRLLKKGGSGIDSESPV